MTKPVRKTQFQDVVVDLWNKVKANFISDVTFDTANGANGKPNNTLKKTKNGLEEEVVPHIVTEWRDLEYVTKYTHANILDMSKHQNQKSLNDTCDDQPGGRDWSIVEFPVEANQEYTILRMRKEKVKIRFEDAQGNKVGIVNETPSTVSGFDRYKFQTPPNTVKAILEVKYSRVDERQTMIIQGDHMNTTFDTQNKIPFADGELLQVGTEVSFKFDSSNSSLVSTTYESAIKELDKKLANAGTGNLSTINSVQPTQGNIDLSITDKNADVINFKVGNANFGTLECMTDADVEEIKRLFV